MVRPYKMLGQKRKKRKAEKYEKEVEEPEPETVAEEVEEEEEDGGNGAESSEMKSTEEKEMKSVEEVGTELPSFPIVEQGQKSVNRPGVIFILEKASLEIAKVGKSMQLLNSDKHSNFLRRHGKNPAEYRPDIAHQDRIGNLPDEILIHILSNLKLRESTKTSVLSRRWLNLWTLVPRLCFDATKEQPQYRPANQWIQERSVFVNWVGHVLSLHKSSYLQEFRIFYQLSSCHQMEIDNWLDYAFGRGVERLELNFTRFDIFDGWNEDTYILTNQLLERIAQKVGFSRVRALCFSVVNIPGEAIEFLLRKCPLLEDLRVMGSKVLVNLVVSGPSLLLKHLQITRCWRFESITISDTNIVSLRVSTRDKGHLLLNRLPMLTDMWIVDGRFSNESNLFSQFSCCLSQLIVLTLETISPKKFMETDKLPQLHNLRRLVLSTDYYAERSLIGLTSLIDSCPRLEEFALMLNDTCVFMGNVEQKKAMKQSLKGLRVFQLYGYRGRYKYESELIMFFIENAVALEKIIIDTCEVTTFWHDSEPVETQRAKEYRRRAIETFKGVVVPKHVQLVIL